MKKKISNYLRKKDVKRFSIFFVLAFLFLIFSKLSNDYKQNIALKVELFNLDEEIVVEYDSLNKITALVESKGFTLLPYLFKESKTILIDAKKDVIKRDNEFVFEVQRQKYKIEDKLGSSYKLLNLKPDSLTLKYSTPSVSVLPPAPSESFKVKPIALPMDGVVFSNAPPCISADAPPAEPRMSRALVKFI